MITKAELRSKGQLTLPAAVREALHAHTGDDIEFTLDADGVVTLRGRTSIPTDRASFWTPEWQAGEAVATAEIARGDTAHSDDTESFLASLG